MARSSTLKHQGAALAEVMITVVLLSVLLFIVFQLAVTRPEPGFDELKKENEFLRHELDLLAESHAQNQARIALLERETGVVRKANRLLREDEATRQAEINQLQRELDFFSRLAGTGGEQSGLGVYQVELSRTDSPMVFRFILTLTQNIRRASIISGKASLDVEGTLDDRPVTLYWAQLTEGTTPGTDFRFKYFEQLEGYLMLPEFFNPTRLVVSLDVKDQRKPLTQTFDWHSLLVDPEGESAY